MTLKDLDLSAMCLREIDFSGCTFINVHLRYTDLQYAKLENVKLQNTDLCFADLQRSCLKNITVQNINLKNANLRGAWLSETVQLSSDVKGEDLKGIYNNCKDLKARNQLGDILIGKGLMAAE